jgi:EpsD family peptidyl-prolyl cis-trans isomerase
MRTDAFMKLVRIVATCIGLALLAGCSKPAEKPSGQVIATVNGVEITYLQLNHFLQSRGIPAATDEAKLSAIDSLIERELLLQEALNGKLDRDADVLQSIDAARRQILIDAYAQRMVFGKSTVSQSEKQVFYGEHPELFENRRVYDLAIFNVAKASVTPELIRDLNAAKTPDATRALLTAVNVRFDEHKGERSAEQLPMSMVKQFAGANVGDIVMAEQGEAASLMQITSIAVKPVQYADATAMIDQYLIGVRNREAMEARVKQLRDNARIAYAKEFAPAEKSVVTASASQ